MAFMEIMEFRHQELQGALDALQTLHVPLVEKVGTSVAPVGLGDDKGAYYFIPHLAQGLGIPLDQAVNLFYGFLDFFPLLLALAGFWLFFKSGWARAWVPLGLAWFFFATKIWDVYLAGSFSVLCVIPFLLFAWHKPGKNWQWLLLLALDGIFCGFADLVRSHSGTGAILFALLLLVLSPRLKYGRKAGFAVMLLAFFIVPQWQFHFVEKKRDDYLRKTLGTAYEMNTRHSFWHPVYIGLGYVANPYGIEYRDQVAYDKVKEVDPTVVHFSARYEEIMRDQVFLLARKDPGFILKNLFVKFMRVCYYALKFGNLGWIALFYWGIPWRTALPFLAMALFTALPSLLVMPGIPYAAGFVAGATVFGIYATGIAIDKYIGGRKAKTV